MDSSDDDKLPKELPAQSCAFLSTSVDNEAQPKPMPPKVLIPTVGLHYQKQMLMSTRLNRLLCVTRLSN